MCSSDLRERIWSPAFIELGQKLTTSRRNGQDDATVEIDAEAAPREVAASATVTDQATIKAYLDENLKPETTQVYPDRGIRIEAISIFGPDGQPANTLPMQTSFSLIFDYISEQEWRDLRFACHIANPSGARISGQAFPSIHGHFPGTSEGQSLSIRFHFSGGLLPGLYFVGGGIKIGRAHV